VIAIPCGACSTLPIGPCASRCGVRPLWRWRVDALYEVGISGEDQIVGISQGWKLTGAIKTAERKLADKTLRHPGQG
jgi:hypothetical protein